MILCSLGFFGKADAKQGNLGDGVSQARGCHLPPTARRCGAVVPERPCMAPQVIMPRSVGGSQGCWCKDAGPFGGPGLVGPTGWMMGDTSGAPPHTAVPPCAVWEGVPGCGFRGWGVPAPPNQPSPHLPAFDVRPRVWVACRAASRKRRPIHIHRYPRVGCLMVTRWSSPWGPRQAETGRWGGTQPWSRLDLSTPCCAHGRASHALARSPS